MLNGLIIEARKNNYSLNIDKVQKNKTIEETAKKIQANHAVQKRLQFTSLL
jgi:hypothetical protein